MIGWAIFAPIISIFVANETYSKSLFIEWIKLTGILYAAGLAMIALILLVKFLSGDVVLL